MRTPKKPVSDREPEADRSLRKAVEGLKGWGSAEEVLVKVRSVPTIFVDFDRALRVGGMPLGRFYVVHGPTSGGKSAFILGLVRSFLQRKHLVGYVDAEHTTPDEWVQQMVAGCARDPLFRASRPQTYEETIDAVDTLLRAVADLKKTRPELATLIVVDSINKLVPERELATLRKLGADAIDKGWGRLRAAMNQAWIDHLTPLLAKNDVAMIAVAQERTTQGASEDDKKYGRDWHVKGGAGILYDSSLNMRVSMAAKLYSGEKGDKDSAVIGAKHRVRIHKSKVEWLEGAHTDCYFHLSNGQAADAGFELGRDLFGVAVELGVIKQSGSWYSWGKKRWQGEPRAVTSLRDRETRGRLEAEVRVAIGKL
jgi:recombination protein RecA